MKPIFAPLLAASLWLAAAAAVPAQAQVRGAPAAAAEPADTARRVVLTGHGLMYLDFGRFYDPSSESRWVMADAAMGGGAALHVEVGDGFWVGAEAAVARTDYQRWPRQGSTVLGDGRATVATFLAVGRISGAGLGRLGGLGGLGRIGGLGYLSVGIGAIRYGLEDLDGGATDFLFSTAGGLEYVWASGRAAYFELRRFWAFHEREGVESATVNHARADLGIRVPLRR